MNMEKNEVLRVARCVGSVCLLAISPLSGYAAESAQCVANVEKVIAAGSTPVKTTPLPAELTAKLDAAVRSSLARTAAPGVVVGVTTPAGTWKAAYGVAD